MSSFNEYKKDFGQYVDDLDFTESVFNETDIFKSMNSIYGVPTCVMDLVKTALIKLLPSSFLVNISKSFESGKTKAFNSIESMTNNYFFNNGLWVYDPVTGKFSWNEENKDFGLDEDSLGFFGKMSEWLAETQGFIAGGLAAALGTAEQIEDLMQCISKFLAWEASKQEPKDFAFGFGPLLGYKEEIDTTVEFITNLSVSQEAVNAELFARAQDPTLEPLNLSDQTVEFESPFRLAFGPPQSTTGTFLLSIDGMYYDAQNGGIPDVEELFLSSIPESGDEWKLEHEAALGGKGQSVDKDTFATYADTVFDINNIDTSKAFDEYYAIDPLLNKIKGQKNKEIEDIKTHITELTASGYDEDSALVVNSKQSLQSVAAKYEEKLNKRRKQIELYVKFSGTSSKEEAVPVNDFSYITNEVVVPELDKQQKLIFRQGELDGVILPVEPKFVKVVDSTKVSSFNHLNLGDVGSGEIVTVDSVDGSSTTIVSLSDKIVTSEIIGVYNFLEAHTYPTQTSYDYSNYKVVNSEGVGNFGFAAGDSSSMFVSGLSIPYLDGTSSNYIMLPDTDEYRDLTYKKAGFTIDFWVHSPTLEDETSWAQTPFKKVLLTCANNGSNNSITSGILKLDKSSDVVRGLEIGFTTDRRTVSGLAHTDSSAINHPDTYLSLYVAPTQSYGTSSVGYIHKTDSNGCIIQEDNLCSLVASRDMYVNSISVEDIATSFVNVCITVDPKNNLASIYLNGNLLTSDTMKNVFGVDDYFTANLPSPALDSSYNPTTGPKLNPSKYTPWVLGGDFLQGLLDQDTGLKAHVGSLKFYAKALDSSEVLQNYNAQEGYFTNIAT